MEDVKEKPKPEYTIEFVQRDGQWIAVFKYPKSKIVAINKPYPDK